MAKFRHYFAILTKVPSILCKKPPRGLSIFSIVAKFPHYWDSLGIAYPKTRELAIVAEFPHYWDSMGITYPKTQESAIVAKFPHYLRFPGIHSAHHSFSFGFMAALQHVYSTLFPLVGKFPHYWYFPQITPLQFNIFAIVAKFRHYFAIVAKFRHYFAIVAEISPLFCNSGEIPPLFMAR